MILLSSFSPCNGSSSPTSSRLSCGGDGGLRWIFSRISRIIVSTLFLLVVVVVKTGRSQTVGMSGDLKTATATSSSSNDDQNHEFLLPQIVTASEGGWPTHLVGEPFRYGEKLYCHTKNPHSSADDGSDPSPAECIGFDWHSRDENIKRCKFSSLTNTTHIDLRCPYDDTESSYYHIHLSSRCCERFIENDASIYKATNGLHFTSMVNPMPMVKGVQLMQRDYPSVTYDGTTLLLHYNFYDFDTRKYHEIPDRVLKSEHYKDIYRAMPRHITLSVDQKLQHAKRVVSLQQQHQQIMSNHDSKEVDLPFPKTYLTCKDALEAKSSTQDTLYYYKNARKTRGEGIQVLTRQQLEKKFFRGQCKDWDNVIQEAVTDLETISNKRFDIRFYILTHNGRMYLHQNALMIYLENAPGSIYDPTDPISMKLSASRELGKEGAVVRVYSNEQPELWSKFWLKSIANGLVTAQPVFDKVMQASKADPHLYQIWGGDAMIRSNGQVVFPEFNDWPNINYSEEKSHTSKLLSPTEFGPIIQGDFEDEYINFVGQMSADFYSIVLNLADRSDPTNMCGGRVTEILPPAPTPSNPSEECEA